MFRQADKSLYSETSVYHNRRAGGCSREVASDTSDKYQVEHPVFTVGKQGSEVTEIIGAKVHIKIFVRSAVIVVQKRRAASRRDADAVYV